MTTFDSSRYDIPTLIEKLHDQRFDGYDADSLASEVEKFRDGTGTASMGNAVEALKSVVTTLADTDTTLREQLSALGVTWQSQAGGQASAVLADQAGFATQAYDNVAQAAQLIFDQGEAFNRTKNKLPDPETLRQGDGGLTLGDTLFSLLGFETDHASAVKANGEARAQAVDALNAYAHDSGDYLASSQTVPEPQSLETVSPPGNVIVPDVGSEGNAPSIPSPTVAAGAKDAVPTPQSAPVHRPVQALAPEPPTPAIGIPVPSTSSVQATPQSTTPSSATSASSSTPVIEVPAGGQTGRDDSETTRSSPGRGVPGGGSTTPIGPGEQVGGVPGGTPGANTGGAWGRPVSGGGGGVAGFAGGPGPAPGGGEALLGKGKMVGATTPAPSSATSIGPGFTATRGPGGVGGVGDSAAAIGAGAAGGATSGEQERRGRGVGRGAPAPGGGRPVRQMDIGDLPEEEEAQRANRATPQTPSREHTRSILEPAATQDGDEDAEHVRRFGIDDRDLFTDQRAVSPDVIGDRAMPEDR